MNTALLDNFQLYLDIADVKKSSRKNYLADCRNFLEWLISSGGNVNVDGYSQILHRVNVQTIQEYVKMLQEKETAPATINRRLSGLRIFFDFCCKAEITRNNPARELSNVSISLNQPDAISIPQPLRKPMSIEKLLQDYEKALEKSKLNQATVKNYFADVNQFFIWLNNQSV